MITLIKLGGTLLDAAESRKRLAHEIAQAFETGLQAIVVHGGGKQMTRFLAERGIQSHFVNGLRVTTPEVLDAVLKILAGSVNQELVGAFLAAGARPVGLSGMDALITEARQMNPDLGSVGQPVQSNTALPKLLIEHGYLPVVACVAGDREGRFYNVNADQMAASIAGAFPAQRLIFLTDVEGVRGAENQTLPSITTAECADLIARGVATGGMQAKLDAACGALRAGVREVVIAPGAQPGIIATLLSDKRVGTRLT
ncbi:MAG TPA: acetylglutamate kinase [Bryobacteraceae bacterium]|nr:acetylglutamate kinase [Bryobacteraceae bacterium]